jgi:pimeloyl-ACP methyl ester carboxylesterase
MKQEHLDGALRDRTVETNGVRLRVVEAGPAASARTVLLLHGFPEFSYAWERMARALAAAGHRVLVPDQRGYNLSDKPARVASYNSEVLARDVLGLIETSGCAQVDLVAHDWGGHAAWWTAARYPQRIRRLVVMNAAHPRVMFRNVLLNPRQTWKSWYVFGLQLPWIPEWILGRNRYEVMRRFIRWDGDEGPMTVDDAERYIEAWSRPRAFTSMVNWYRAAFRTWPLLLDEKRIHPPTLLIWGENDRFLHRSLAQQSVDHCDNGRVTYLAGASHWVHHEKPEAVARLILSFLE